MDMVDVFQAAVLLLSGLAYNQLAQFKKAKEMLEMGLIIL
jgi:hypothetical protein